MVTVVNKLLKKLKNKGAHDIAYQIGSIKITIPAEHNLPGYQKAFRLYDQKLGRIAKIINMMHPTAVAVDIGANVGDSAAVIRDQCDMTVVCIEGQAYFYDYLKQNVAAIGNVVPIFAFVGDEEKTIQGEIIPTHGTAGIKASGKDLIKIRKLADLLNEAKVPLEQVKLIKTDTDGFDFTILLGNQDFIKKYTPSIFFEYDLFNPTELQKSIATIELLVSLGYQFVLYDNYGHILSCIKADVVDRFKEINRYLLSTKKYGGGMYYFDVFATTDAAVYEQVLQMEDSFIADA